MSGLDYIKSDINYICMYFQHEAVSDIYNEIVKAITDDKYIVTKSLIEKEKAKIENENYGDWSSKFIPRLINTVFYCLVKVVIGWFESCFPHRPFWLLE